MFDGRRPVLSHTAICAYGAIFFLAKNREAISAESTVLEREGRLQVIENCWRAMRACGLFVCPPFVTEPYKKESPPVFLLWKQHPAEVVPVRVGIGWAGRWIGPLSG